MYVTSRRDSHCVSLCGQGAETVEVDPCEGVQLRLPRRVSANAMLSELSR